MSSIITLPSELIELIVASSDWQSLLNIRLTCRALSLGPVPSLFRHVDFWLEAGSLQKLVSIATTPYLGKHVKHISCGTEEFFNFDFQYFRDVVLYEHYRLGGRIQPENPAAGEFRDLTRREQNRQKATWSEYRDCYKKQRRLYSDNVAIRCLTLAISSLPALTTVEIFDPSEDWWPNRRYYTPRALLKKLRLLRDDMLLLTHIAIPLPRGGRQLRILIQVLAESERRIEDFHIRLFSSGIGGKNYCSHYLKL